MKVKGNPQTKKGDIKTLSVQKIQGGKKGDGTSTVQQGVIRTSSLYKGGK